MLYAEYKKVADNVGCTPAQLAIAWTLAKAPHIVPIPGTRHTAYVEENFGAIDVILDTATVAKLDDLINQDTVAGPRYPAGVQVEIDTEEF